MATTGPNGEAQLTLSPGRIDPTHIAYNSEGDSRKPLAGEFTFNGQTVFVINVHLSSKGGDEQLYGTPPQVLAREPLRTVQAQLVSNLVSGLLAIDPNANVIVLGDANEFYFRPPMLALEASGLTNLWYQLPANERYNYEFNNYGQNLDNYLVSNNLLNNLLGYDVVHINAEFQQQNSDHDPLVAAFHVPIQIPVCNGLQATIYVQNDVIVGGSNNAQAYVAGLSVLRGGNGADVIVGTDGKDSIDGGNNNDIICAGNGDDRVFGGNGNDISSEKPGLICWMAVTTMMPYLVVMATILCLVKMAMIRSLLDSIMICWTAATAMIL